MPRNRNRHLKTVNKAHSTLMVQAFLDVFWLTSTQLVSFIVPIVALFAVFRLIHDIIWRD